MTVSLTIKTIYMLVSVYKLRCLLVVSVCLYSKLQLETLFFVPTNLSYFACLKNNNCHSECNSNSGICSIYNAVLTLHTGV